MPVNSVAVYLACALLLGAGARAYRHGDGTAYSGDGEKDETGYNSCQFGHLADRWETYYAALPSQVFDRDEHCGRCIRLRGTNADAPGKWVTVKVVDECASCAGDNDVDLSSRALKEATGYGWDRKPVIWKFTSCRHKGGDDDDDEGEDAGSGGS